MPTGELDRARQEGRLVMPDPQRMLGIIDTAAEKTCIQANIVDKFLLNPVGYTPLHSTSGQNNVAVYAVTLQLAWKLEHPPDPIPVHICALPEILGAEVLIGLDVLRFGEFIIYGSDRRYELILPRTTCSPQ